MTIQTFPLFRLPRELSNQVLDHVISDLRKEPEHYFSPDRGRKSGRSIMDFGLICKYFHEYTPLRKAIADKKLLVKSSDSKNDRSFARAQLSAHEQNLSEINLFSDSKPEMVAPCQDPDTLVSLTQSIDSFIDLHLNNPEKLREAVKDINQRCRIAFKNMRYSSLEDQERILNSISLTKANVEQFARKYSNLIENPGFNHEVGDGFEPKFADLSKAILLTIEQLDKKGIQTSLKPLSEVYRMVAER